MLLLASLVTGAVLVLNPLLGLVAAGLTLVLFRTQTQTQARR